MERHLVGRKVNLIVERACSLVLLNLLTFGEERSNLEDVEKGKKKQQQKITLHAALSRKS